jgi:hypothetical protein
LVSKDRYLEAVFPKVWSAASEANAPVHPAAGLAEAEQRIYDVLVPTVNRREVPQAISRNLLRAIPQLIDHSAANSLGLSVRGISGLGARPPTMIDQEETVAAFALSSPMGGTWMQWQGHVW